jgi:hypothetical protein
MTRFLVAALAAALMLQAWGLLSSRLLPWPDVYGRMPLPVSGVITTSRVLPSRLDADDGSGLTPPIGSTFAPPAPVDASLVAANSDAWPIYAFGRRNESAAAHASLTYLGLNVTLGIIAAVAAALVLREGRSFWNRTGQGALAVLFLILLTDVTHALLMEWPLAYSAVLLTDHLVAIVLAGGSALTVQAAWRSTRTPAAASDPAGTP